jgi:predicted transposase/invertase (TIGR01784 family)
MNMLQNPFFFRALRNDLSFTIDDKLIILYEHQASINPNMGFRFLLYIAEIYEVLVDKKEMYKSVPMSIANPEFYVIYNGRDKYPEKSIVKLSDLFKIKDVENSLELTVTVYNMNKGYNKEIMKHSRTLNEYAEFVAKVREYMHKSKINLTEALMMAIEDCIRNNVLREFLEKYGGEVVTILSREFNFDDALEVREEEAREEEREEIAKNLFKDGVPKEVIIKNTGISAEQMERIAKKYS